MKFHLEFPVSDFSSKISYSDSFLFIGSCFAENVGETFKRYKFSTLINPNGIVYHPLSLSSSLRRYVSNDHQKENELFFDNGCWNSWEHHSEYSAVDKIGCLNTINASITEAHTVLKKCSFLFITFGSAFVYRRNGIPVANCHKQPQKEFTKELLSVTEIVEEYKSLIPELLKFNPKLNIVFTISPVRYIRDGVVENNRSKSVLIQAVHELVKLFKSTAYFPAYELVIDDLRDYRFYERDLVHPNKQAIDYVFDKLKTAAFDEATNTVFEQMKELVQAVEHRPFQNDSAEHKKFKQNYLVRAKKMQEQFPHLNLQPEIDHFCN